MLNQVGDQEEVESTKGEIDDPTLTCTQDRHGEKNGEDFSNDQFVQMLSALTPHSLFAKRHCDALSFPFRLRDLQ